MVPKPLPQLTGLAGEWHGWLKQRELRFQRCAACNRWRHIPRLVCADCGSQEWEWAPSSGAGMVFTWSTTHRPMHPAFTDVPFAQVVIEMAEGPRILSRVADVEVEDLQIGMPVEVFFEDATPEVTLPTFRLNRAGSPT